MPQCLRVGIKGQSQSPGSHYHMISGHRSQVAQLNDKCLDLPAKPSCWPSAYVLTKLREHNFGMLKFPLMSSGSPRKWSQRSTFPDPAASIPTEEERPAEAEVCFYIQFIQFYTIYRKLYIQIYS